MKKRLFDLLIAGLVTASILIWLIPLLALLIRATSSGPPLFIQLRTGRNGRVFPCLKFRTMTYDTNATFRQATQNDMRVTRIGKVLRKTNLDEMPQFLNVLAGHMSVVGPRPHPLPLDAKHWETMPGYRERYVVKPGITGLAQARGARGETEQEHKMKVRVRYDHFYIRRQSTRLDAKICWWTVLAAIRGNKNAW
ncbi:sugar transferase [Spirosoma flavus]